MNLKYISDQALHDDLKRLVHQEREILTSVLHHLREVERRGLFSKMKYSSLFDYAVSELKYPEDQAARRISAMRLLRDVPEVEEKIASGALSLTNLVLAQTLFSKEKKVGLSYDPSQKAMILMQLEHKSTRAAQKLVGAINPEMKSKTVRLTYGSIDDVELRNKLLTIKGRFAHSNPNLTLVELLHKLCDEELKSESESPAAPRVNSAAEIRRQIWRRDQGRCLNCESVQALEIDHIVPKAAGGKSTIENLRLLCRSCNQRAAIEYFGMKKMAQYLRSPEGRLQMRIQIQG